MSNTGRLICYLIAFAAFTVGALVSQSKNAAKWTITLIAVGLAFLALVPLWDAIEAT